MSVFGVALHVLLRCIDAVCWNADRRRHIAACDLAERELRPLDPVITLERALGEFPADLEAWAEELDELLALRTVAR